MEDMKGITMFETPLTVVGTVVTDPIRRTVGGQELIKLRVASNSRRRDADGTWTAGNSLYITVNCWGRLVTGVGAALGKGSPVIVVGTIYTSEYEDRDGNRRSPLEMRAHAVGPDLSRCVARIEKIVYSGPDAEQRPAATDTERPAASGEEQRPAAAAEPEADDGTDDKASPADLSRIGAKRLRDKGLTPST
jgi:single-strand DNA-binding protein